MKSAKTELDAARQLALAKEEIHNRLKVTFMKVDLELAELDGRLTKTKSAKTRQKFSIASLTKEQILAIAEQLGVSVQIEED